MSRAVTTSGSTRVLIGALCAAVIGLQVMPQLHHVVVEHEVCAEHGELLHTSGDQRRELDEIVTAVASRERSPEPTIRGSAEEAGHGDEAHCAVHFTTLSAEDTSETSTGHTVTPTALLDAPSSEARPVCALTVAPKGSPPDALV